MATYLPSSGAIDLNSINTLFGRGTNLNSYRGTQYYTSSTGPNTFSSGAITMNDFHGTGPTANRVSISYTFAANTANASLSVSSIGGYSAGNSDITITVNSGIYLYATSTGSAGLTLTGGAAGDTITLVNNGFIMGMGSAGATNNANNAGGTGGTALSLGFNTTVNNTNGAAYIGGGGGGGGARSGSAYQGGAGGGGAGGGAGGNYSNGGFVAGGAGGGIGASGSNGTTAILCSYQGTGGNSAGGGGRIFPGTGGASAYIGVGGGAGGGGSGNSAFGGAGGSANAAGGAGTGGQGGGGGGGWGASGGTASSGGAGGAGGKAVALNGNTVTWVSGNTTRVYGAVA